MGRKPQKQYSDEFKRNAVRQVMLGGKSVAEVARSLEIPYGGLYEWVRQAKGTARPGHGAPAEQRTDEQKELERLRKENEQLKLQLEFSKKVAAFLAKQNE
jgi:transposase